MLEPTSPPERALYLKRAVVAIAARIVGQMADELAAPSTDSPSLQERALLRLLRPALPMLQQVLLSRLSEVDPVALESNIGAIATAIESLLAQAPGEALPRFRIDWDEAGRLILVPLAESHDASPLEARPH